MPTSAKQKQSTNTIKEYKKDSPVFGISALTKQYRWMYMAPFP